MKTESIKSPGRLQPGLFCRRFGRIRQNAPIEKMSGVHYNKQEEPAIWLKGEEGII